MSVIYMIDESILPQPIDFNGPVNFSSRSNFSEWTGLLEQSGAHNRKSLTFLRNVAKNNIIKLQFNS